MESGLFDPFSPYAKGLSLVSKISRTMEKDELWLLLGKDAWYTKADRAGLGHLFQICQPSCTLLFAYLTCMGRYDSQLYLIGMLSCILLLYLFALGHPFSSLCPRSLQSMKENTTAL